MVSVYSGARGGPRLISLAPPLAGARPGKYSGPLPGRAFAPDELPGPAPDKISMPRRGIKALTTPDNADNLLEWKVDNFAALIPRRIICAQHQQTGTGDRKYRTIYFE